jgi:hypothetical protein
MYCARRVSEFVLLSLYGAPSRISSDAAEFITALQRNVSESSEATLIDQYSGNSTP